MRSAKTPLYLFAVGPAELRVLLGWRDERLVGPFRSLQSATRGRAVICSGDLEAEARDAGLLTGALPPDALEARALFAAFALWRALLATSPPPRAIRALLDSARALHVRWAGAPGSWTLDFDGRRWRVRLEGTASACTALVARCEHAPFELELRLERGPDFAARALAEAGWPVVPLPMARGGSQRRPLDLEDLLTLTRIARRAAARLPRVPRIGETAGRYAVPTQVPARLACRFAGLPGLLALARALVQARAADDPAVAEAFHGAVDALLSPQGPLRALAIEEAMRLYLRVPPRGTLEGRIEARLEHTLQVARSPDEVQGAVAALLELEAHRECPAPQDLVDQVEELAGDVLEELEGTPAVGLEAVG